jgi:diaminopimelate decarboxylase
MTLLDIFPSLRNTAARPQVDAALWPMTTRIEVSSAAGLATALAGGLDPARVVLAVNAMTLDDLRKPVAAGVGRIVIDSVAEIAYLNELAPHPQRVLIGVADNYCNIHGYFGELVTRILHTGNLELVGLHCHQVGDPGSVGRLIAAMADVRAHHRVILTELSVGSDHALGEIASTFDDAVESACARERFPRPRLCLTRGLS